MSALKFKARNFWKHEEELILKEWADKAQCYYWMHLNSHRKYRWLNSVFIIPVTIISTVTGSALFASNMFGQFQQLITIIIGILNILTGVTTSVYQYLKIAETNEAHKSATLSWNKFYEDVKNVLMKNPLDREEPADVLEKFSQTYYHLLEFCPAIPEDIITDFRNTFRHAECKDRMFIPNICDKFASTRIYNPKLVTDLLKKVNNGHISELFGTSTPLQMSNSPKDDSPKLVGCTGSTGTETDTQQQDNTSILITDSPLNIQQQMTYEDEHVNSFA